MPKQWTLVATRTKSPSTLDSISPAASEQQHTVAALVWREGRKKYAKMKTAMVGRLVGCGQSATLDPCLCFPSYVMLNS